MCPFSILAFLQPTTVDKEPLFAVLILFENQIQTTSASPCRTQVQPTASFLVCSLIFIEYQNEKADPIQESAIIQRLIFKFFMIFFIEIN